jgi:ketosteroid isomerase-like protein
VPNQHARRQAPSRAVTASGIDHVQLSYEYMECGDIDGYGSLLDDDVVLDRPDAPLGHGRDKVVRMLTDRVIPPARHELEHVIADGDHVVVVGRLSQGAGPFTAALEQGSFVDIFTLSETGMLRGCRRYYYSPPAEPGRGSA